MKDETVSVLLIEDDPGEACLVRELLRRCHDTKFELRHAANLANGIAFLRVAPADIVLLDLTLPDSQGLDTLTSLMTSVPGVPVIVHTGINDDDVGRGALRRGAHDYLVKGRFDGRMLYASIRYAVERHTLFQKVAGINQSILELERNRVVQETTSSAVHAISQPLTVLTMVVSELLKDVKTGDRQFENMFRLRESVDTLNRIVRDLANKHQYAAKTYPGQIQVIDLTIAARPEKPVITVAPAHPKPAPVSMVGPARMEV